jgi:ribonuclease P/MRP protein subunit RPP20
MGAAIPHLALLAGALPEILSYGRDELRFEYRTGTVEVQDEIHPEDEGEDVAYNQRSKSTLSVIIRIGEGGETVTKANSSGRGKPGKRGPRKRGRTKTQTSAMTSKAVVFQEPEQDDYDDEDAMDAS